MLPPPAAKMADDSSVRRYPTAPVKSRGAACSPDTLEAHHEFDWRDLDDRAIVRSASASWTCIDAVASCAAGDHQRLGDLLLQARRVSPQQRDACLAEQKRTGERLGGLLVRFGWLSKAELVAVLAFQDRQHGSDGPLRLGCILMAMGIISAQQLQAAMLRQQLCHKRLGELLVEAGHVTARDIWRGLSVQRMLLKAAVAALLALAALTAAPTVHAGSSASVGVSATVLAFSKLNVLFQADQLTIELDDIDRGYMDVLAGSRIEVKCNSRDGFTLTFDPVLNLFNAVQITGLGGMVELGTEGGTVAQRGSGTQPASLQLGYRFILAKNVLPGNYTWPLALSARPL
jgi:hypothetical protein